MTTNKYNRADSFEFAKKVSRKIKGWYSNDTFHDKAVNRIALQREEIISLFEKVEKVSVKKLLRYLDSSGFFYLPSAPNRHHNFPGGLAEHSLGVFRIVEEWNKMTPDERRHSELYKFKLSDKSFLCDILTEKMKYDDMVIASICHDLCKAKHYYFKSNRVILEHNSDSEPKRVHASLSVKRLKDNGIDGAQCEELLLAIRTHMRLFSYPPKNNREEENQQRGKKSMLAIAVWAADKLDASRHPAGKMHRQL